MVTGELVLYWNLTERTLFGTYSMYNYVHVPYLTSCIKLVCFQGRESESTPLFLFFLLACMYNFSSAEEHFTQVAKGNTNKDDINIYIFVFSLSICREVISFNFNPIGGVCLDVPGQYYPTVSR